VAELEAGAEQDPEHIRWQADDNIALGQLIYDDSDPPVEWKARAESAVSEIASLKAKLERMADLFEHARRLSRKDGKRAAQARLHHPPGLSRRGRFGTMGSQVQILPLRPALSCTARRHG
jgi:hypothetical protein